MRKMFIAVAIAVMAAIGFMSAPQAQAQTYPDVSGVTQFTQPANYMSLPGFLRYRYYIDTGRWISREEAVGAVRDQTGSVPVAPTGDMGDM